MKVLRPQSQRALAIGVTASGLVPAVPLNDQPAEGVYILYDPNAVAADVHIDLQFSGTWYRAHTFDIAGGGSTMRCQYLPIHGASAIRANKTGAAGTINIYLIEVQNIIVSLGR